MCERVDRAKARVTGPPSGSGTIKSVALALVVAAGCAHTEPDWAYDGPAGPAGWPQVNAAYAPCAQGRAQSPIDIVEVVPRQLPDIQFKYGQTRGALVNDGRVIRMNVDAGSHIVVGGLPFQLVAVEFHTPSEHKAAGTHFPMEMQLHHRSADGHIAIVSVMARKGTPNPILETLLAHAPRAPGDEVSTENAFSAAALLPANRTYMRYAGSLTRPPCNEGVTWLVLADPVGLSEARLAAVESILGKNNRPVQPMNGRSVLMDR